MLNIALPKGRLGEKVYAMFEAAGYECPSIRENSRKLVFENEGNYKRALIRYYCLCIPQMLVSAALVTFLNGLLANTAPIIATAIKFLVDTFLFFISYQIQREWVFSSKK